MELEIKELIEKIKKLSYNEKMNILYIFKTNNINYTKNSNGYFFNFNSVDIDLIKKILKCINSVEENRERIITLNKQREEKLEYYKNLIKDNIEKSNLDYIKNIETKLLSSESFLNIKKKINKKPQTDDPDDLLYQYKLSKKITKKSPYYSLYQCTKTNNRKCTKKDDEDSGDDGIGGVEGVDDVEVDDDDNISIKDSEYDPETEKHTEKISDHSDIFSENINSDIDDNEYDIDDDIDSNDDFEQELTYYKNLLYKNHGFSFDYDKDIKMVKEEYII